MNDSGNEGTETERMRELVKMKMEIFADQIRKLSELRKEDLLTEEEFSAKKAELLKRI